MTSGSTFPQRLTRIDDLTRSDHSYLTPDDTCYFFGEYSARKGFAFSPTNNLIINFKKSVDRRGRPEWRHKETAIQTAAAAFRAAITEDWLTQATLVPIPPSKSLTDPLYDDRMVQLLRAIRAEPPLDIRELIVQTTSATAAHEEEHRPGPTQLLARYGLAPDLREPRPPVIGVVDDVLTTGAHFKAAKTLLCNAFPNVSIVGLFIARRVPEAVDIEDI